MLRMGPVHARDNGQGVSSTEPESTARYQDLLYAQMEYDVIAPIGIGPGAYGTTDRQGSRGPTKTPGGLKVASKYMAARHYKTIINMETISVLISFPHPGVSCLII